MYNTDIRNIKIVLLWGMLLVSLSGCNIYKFAYNNLSERITYSKIDDTFKLDRRQKGQLKEDLHAIHLWHRRNELPKYANLLKEFSEKIPDGVTEDEAKWAITQIKDGEWKRLLDKIAPNAGHLLLSLSDAQLANAEMAMKSAAEKRFEKLNLPVDKYVKERMKIARRWMKLFLGDVTSQQTAAVESYITENRIGEYGRYEQVKKNRADFFALLHRHPPEQELAQVAIRWLSDQVVYENSEFQEAEAKRQSAFVALLVRVDQLNKPEQRNYLMKRLAELRSVLLELAAE